MKQESLLISTNHFIICQFFLLSVLHLQSFFSLYCSHKEKYYLIMCFNESIKTSIKRFAFPLMCIDFLLWHWLHYTAANIDQGFFHKLHITIVISYKQKLDPFAFCMCVWFWSIPTWFDFQQTVLISFYGTGAKSASPVTTVCNITL